jgi:hypothetical protein
MASWYDVRLPDDPPEWIAHCEACRNNQEEIKRLLDLLKPDRPRWKTAEPSEERVKQLRAAWMTRQARGKPPPDEITRYWQTVRARN